MEIKIAKSTILTLAKKNNQLDIVHATMFRVNEALGKIGVTELDDVIWNKFVKKMVDKIGNCSLQKALTVVASNDSLTIFINDEFIIDTINVGGDIIVAAMKVISMLQKQSVGEIKSFEEKWITVKTKEGKENE